MSKKNSSAILKSGFQGLKDSSKVYLDFKNKLLKLKKKSFLVAVSGGPDSLALVALSKALMHEKKLNFFYVLVDHNLRKNSANEANQVKKLLQKHSLHLNILLNKKKIKKNIQGIARKKRYEMLEKFSYKKKVNIILTAHNLEDQVETFFIRLSRGSGLRGLSAMRPLTKLNQKIFLFRPFLETKKKDLIKISKSIFGKYIKDPSNQNNKYLRTKIRSLKKPLIKSGINYSQIIRSINNLASSSSILEKYNRNIIKDVINKKNNMVLIHFNKFKILDDEIKISVINDSIKLLKKNYYNLRSKKVINLIKQLKFKSFKKATLGGCLFFLKRDKLCLKEEKI
tara:strand:- start:5490 stop:6509 length:1020 start_codon:yes stop_codon:yes gene_type:complete